MDSNLITISSILPKTNIPDFNLGRLNAGKEVSRFFVEQNDNPVKTRMTDNKADIVPSEVNDRSDEDLSVSQKLQDVRDDDKSSKKDVQKEDQQSDSSSGIMESNENVRSEGGYILSKTTNQVGDEQLDDIKQLLKVDEKLDRIKNLLLDQSVEKSGIKIYSTSVKDGTINIQVDTQTDNTPEQDGIADLIKTVTGNLKKGITNSGAEAEENAKQLTGEGINNESETDILNIKNTNAEGLINNKGNYPVTDGKVSVLENDSIKDIAEDLISQAKVDENEIKETLLTGRNSDNEKQSDMSQGIAESSKIREYIHSLSVSKSDSAVEKIDITNLQASAGQAKNNSDSSSDNKADSVISQIASHNTVVTGQNDSSIANVRIVNQTQQGGLEDISANVGKQILDSIHSSMAQKGGEKQITVNLNPPELGQVSIKFQEQEAHLTGLLEVSKAQTKSEIEQALPQIIRDLSDSGINIKRLEVVLTTGERTEQDTPGGDSLFYNQQQQDFNNQSLYGGNRDLTGFHEWMASNINSISNPGSDNSLLVEDSINILI